jgi:hypothetical protein
MTQHRRIAAIATISPRTDIPKEYRLTGTDSDYITLPHGADINFDRTSSFTISAYVKFSSASMGTVAMIVSKRGATGAGFQFFKNATDHLQVAAVGAGVQSAALNETYLTILVDTWHLCTVVWAGGPTAVKFYLDGKDGVTNIAANNLTSDVMTNTVPMYLGTRLNTPIFATMQYGRFMVHNRALTVNEIPDKMWNYGKPQAGNVVANCVRDYNFINDVFSTNYIVKDNIGGANGTSVNMTGVELVAMNSVMVPKVLGIQASPYTTLQNFIGWDSAGLNATYDVEVSDDGSTGWTTLATMISTLSYIHTVGSANTQKFYRVHARGVGTSGTYSDVVDATTFTSGYTDSFYFNTRRLGDNSYNFGLSVETQRVAPQGYYDDISNKTYFVFMSRAEQGYDMAIFAYYYDHVSATFSDPKYVGLKSRQGLDRHPIPACIVADDGHILVAFSDFHNAPMQIFRSDNPGSINSFTRLGEIGTITDYAEFRKFSNGDILLFCRYYIATTQSGLGVFVSTDDGLTWGSMQKVVEYAWASGRVYPMLMPQDESIDTVHVLATPRNDTGGPFPLDPDKVGYFKDYGYAYCNYVADGLRFRNAGNSFSQDIVASGPISEANWQSTFQYHDSVGTHESGLPVAIAVGTVPYIATYDDTDVYKITFWNGSSWTVTTLTWSDGNTPSYTDGVDVFQSFTFGYHGIQALVWISGSGASMVTDLYVTEQGVVKRYRNSDGFTTGTCTLQDANVLPDVDGLLYERGTTTWNLFQASEPFLFYSIKKSVPTPDPTSPGAWSDIVFKRLF